MSSVKWFSYLKSSDEDSSSTTKDGKPKRALLDIVEPEIKSLIVCQELKFRNFAWFNTYYDFARFVYRDVIEPNRCCYEVIFGNLPQKPYFDCECLRTTSDCLTTEVKSSKPSHALTLTEEEGDTYINKLKEAIKRTCPSIADRDILVFSSHGPAKLSYHVIVDRWCYSDNTENKAFHDEVMKHYDVKFHGIVDHLMYKGIQQLRIYLNHKFGSDRTKRLSRLSTWQPDVKVESEDHNKVLVLGASLIGNASYCTLLPSFKPPEDTNIKYEYDDIELKPADIDSAYNMASNTLGSSFTFTVQHVKGGMIMLKRTRRGFCEVCQREHDNENAYLTVTNRGDVYFYCRRSEKGIKKDVGILGDIVKPRPRGEVKETSIPLLPLPSHPGFADIKPLPLSLPLGVPKLPSYTESPSRDESKSPPPRLPSPTPTTSSTPTTSPPTTPPPQTVSTPRGADLAFFMQSETNRRQAPPKMNIVPVQSQPLRFNLYRG